MSDRKLAEAREIALKKGIISKPEQLEISKAKNKRFTIVKDGRRVNFGSWPFRGSGSYLDHRSDTIRANWRARHSKILLKDGTPAYSVPDTPSFLAWHILW